MRYGLLIIAILLFGLFINIFNNKKEIKTVIEESVISAKYDNGFILLEIGESKEQSNIEKYNIELVDITYIGEEEKLYLRKCFNGYGKLISIELFCNKSIF